MFVYQSVWRQTSIFFYIFEKIDSAKPLQVGEYKLMSQLNRLRYIQKHVAGA